MLEKLNEKRIELKALILLNYRPFKSLCLCNDILIFCYGGIGNIVMMFDLITLLRTSGKNVTCVYFNNSIRDLLEYRYRGITLLKIDELKPIYTVCVCNFLNLKKEIINKIIDLRIVHRMGHEGKFMEVFNYLIPFNNIEKETNQNIKFYQLIHKWNEINDMSE